MKYGNNAITTVTATTAAYPGFPEEITLYCENGTALIMGTKLHVQYSDGTEKHFGADKGTRVLAPILWHSQGITIKR
jgi:hypothetical protein